MILPFEKPFDSRKQIWFEIFFSPVSIQSPPNLPVSKLRNILGMEKNSSRGCAVVSLGNSLRCTSDEFVFSLHGPPCPLLFSDPKISNQKRRAPQWNQFTAGRKSIFELFRNSLKALETWNWQRPPDSRPTGNGTFYPFPYRSTPFDGIFPSRRLFPPRRMSFIFLFGYGYLFFPNYISHNFHEFFHLC